MVLALALGVLASCHLRSSLCAPLSSDLGDVEDALQEGYWHYGRSPKTLTEPAAHVDVRRVVEVRGCAM